VSFIKINGGAKKMKSRGKKINGGAKKGQKDIIPF
jgi:hypothetical protein